MADNKKSQSSANLAKSVGNIISNLISVARSTNYSTYGMSKELFNNVDKMMSKLQAIQEKDRNSIDNTIKGSLYNSSRINTFGLTGVNKPKRNNEKSIYSNKPENLFDLISENKNLFYELKQHILLNNKFYETIQDYEILRRAIPQISRVIDLLINSILTPEAITSEIFNISYNIKDESKKELASKIKEKYDLNQKVRTIVENYLILGVEYITVVPYKAIVEAIKQDGLDRNSRTRIIKESSLLHPSLYSNRERNRKENYILKESTVLDCFAENIRKNIDSHAAEKDRGLKLLNEKVNEYISGIRVYKSNKKLAYDAALVEAVSTDKDSYMFESSYEEFFSDNKKLKLPKSKDSGASEGLITNNDNNPSDYDKIQLRGCKIERLDPSRVWPLRIKDTVVAYIYIEERRDDQLQFNLRQTLQQSFAFYRIGPNSNAYNEQSFKMMEDNIIRAIGNNIIANLSPKFLEANFDQIDVFYEFLRDRQIHREARDIIILHPDDVIEFKRQQGSIMKNAVFFAKLYLLLVISNILTKVRRGSDRTIYYVSEGLSNDIEGSVMEAIEAIQQSQIRFSDIGTISGIIGSVGSIVDLFVPQSENGEKPISPEVISGQQVDMNDEFLEYLIKSIILSFNVPSVVVDYTNEVEFAKTLSMANLDIASSSIHAQSELNGPLTKLVKHVMAYELDLSPDEIETISAKLIPSRSMLMQITNELINTAKELGQNMADVNIIEDNEVIKKIFIKNFVRKYLTYEWNEIDKIINTLEEDRTELTLKEKINKSVSDESSYNDTNISEI